MFRWNEVQTENCNKTPKAQNLDTLQTWIDQTELQLIKILPEPTPQRYLLQFDYLTQLKQKVRRYKTAKDISSNWFHSNGLKCAAQLL